MLVRDVSNLSRVESSEAGVRSLLSIYIYLTVELKIFPF